MKLKKGQYRELINRLTLQIDWIEAHCLNHPVSKELVYILRDIQSATLYLGSAVDQLEILVGEG